MNRRDKRFILHVYDISFVALPSGGKDRRENCTREKPLTFRACKKALCSLSSFRAVTDGVHKLDVRVRTLNRGTAVSVEHNARPSAPFRHMAHLPHTVLSDHTLCVFFSISSKQERVLSRHPYQTETKLSSA